MRLVPCVGEYMKVLPFHLNTTMSLPSALEKMRKARLREAPVVKDGEVVGVLSDRHLSVLLLVSKEFGFNVEDLMTPEPLVVLAKSPLDEVINEMNQKQKDVAVVQEDDGELVGIFSAGDALMILSSLLEVVYEGEPLHGESHSAQPPVLM